MAIYIHISSKGDDIDKTGWVSQTSNQKRNCVIHSHDVFQEIRPGTTNAICQILLLVRSCLPVYHEMADCKQDLDNDLRYRNFPGS